MREAPQQHPTPQRPSQSTLVERASTGAGLEGMMRRGEIGGQALGLIQLVAASSACRGSNGTGSDGWGETLGREAGLN